MSGLSYVPLISSIDHTFWTNLNAKKLDELKLDSRPLPISAAYTNDCANGVPAHLSLSYDSFNEESSVGCVYRGDILNTNTVEEFKAIDYTNLLNEQGTQIWESIKSGAAFSDPSLLNKLHCVCFADLKKYKYNFWFCFPALATSPTLVSQCTLADDAAFGEEQKEKLRQIKGLLIIVVGWLVGWLVRAAGTVWSLSYGLTLTWSYYISTKHQPSKVDEASFETPI
eukprot:sb/3469633/